MVYGGAESVGHESDDQLNERQPLGRRKEAGSPRKQDRKVEQDAEEGVPVVADLQRPDAEGAFAGHAGDGRHTLDKPRRQNFQAQRCHEDNRNGGSQDWAQPTTE